MNDLEKRIEVFERNLAYMNQELKGIKSQMKDYNVELPAAPVMKETRREQIPQVSAPVKTVHQKKEGRTAEQFIGKIAMGVGASILIFIAMVMFATLIIPMFNDTMKMISMYLLSIFLIVLGEVIYKKSKTGYTILSACGVGALFISFVLTCVYFHAIGQIALYILLLLWVFGVAFHMARNRNLAFVAVGQIGVVVATTLSGFSNTLDSDFYLMTIFVVLAEAIFFVSFFKKRFIIDIVNCACSGLCFAILDMIAYFNSVMNGPMFAVVGIGVFTITGAILYLYLRSDTEDRGLASRIFSIVACLIVAFLLGSLDRSLLGSGDYLTIISMLYMLVMIFLADRFCGSKGIIVTRSVHLACMLLCGLGLTSDLRYGVFFVLMIATALFSLIRKDKYYYFLPPVIYAMIAGINFTSAFWTVFSLYDGITLYQDSVLPFVFMLAGLVVLIGHIVMVRYREGEFLPYEIVSYVVLMLSIPEVIGELHTHVVFDNMAVWILCAWTVVQIIVKLTHWCSSSKVPFYVVNAVVMFYALTVCSVDAGSVYMIISVLAAAAVFSLNIKELFAVSKLAGAYIAVKYTLLLIVILYSLSVPSQVMSIVLLAVAAASIAVGFGIKNKSLRLYGLILSIIAIAKLILIDISYDNSLMRACSFLICGLICFAISLAYNRMERKLFVVNDENASEK